MPFGSAGYPPQLENLEDPPAALFVKGRPLPPRERAVAIVGARNCSDLGRELATAIGHDLATSGVCVVSGAARGIDAAGHQGALDAGGHTVAVLGCGIDQAYPRWSERTIERIAKTGTLVSEYPPGIPPEPYHFPARNRIVAAMCTGLVVVEGAEGSGSLISAEHALDLGRDVFAVPGAITNPLAHVPNVLIREGATLIRGVDDLMRDLKLVDGRKRAPMRLDLTLAEQAALELVVGPVLPEKVARGLGVSVPEVLPPAPRPGAEGTDPERRWPVRTSAEGGDDVEPRRGIWFPSPIGPSGVGRAIHRPTAVGGTETARRSWEA